MRPSPNMTSDQQEREVTTSMRLVTAIAALLVVASLFLTAPVLAQDSTIYLPTPGSEQLDDRDVR